MTTFSIRFLGCKVSQTDAQEIRERLLADGHTEAAAGADIAVVNTCCVTHEAVRKSRHAASRAARTHARVYVTGCGANLAADGFAGLPENVVVVLRRSDLGAGWNGGRIEPDLSGGPTCPNYHPKVSDLVITGAAASDFRRTGVDFANEVEVLRTAGMVSRDWRRSIVPEAVPCLRRSLAKGLGAGAKVLSFGRIPFPRVARYTAAFRGVVTVPVQRKTVRVLLDIVLVGRSRTEISLNVAAPAQIGRVISATERRLARTLVARIRA